MDEIISFSYQGIPVRTLNIDGIPWFVGKDVAEILGYSNPQKSLRDHVDDEDKTVNESFTVNGTMGILVNESGLYSLILSSKNLYIAIDSLVHAASTADNLIPNLSNFTGSKCLIFSA